METSAPDRFLGTEIHGFRSMEDLDVGNMLKEARTRWLRPNEIHAILCNNKHFTVRIKPVNFPPSGTILLFDRKMLRNFRKDGHKWKKKTDGKTVKEAHEHLKVGTEERIHVYYAHGEDNPTFVRRCYWLLDKSLDNIVLVHYRETQEGSPSASAYSNTSSDTSNPSTTWSLLEEPNSTAGLVPYGEPKLEIHDSLMLKTVEQRLHDINTLEWDELLVPDESRTPNLLSEGTNLMFENVKQYSFSVVEGKPARLEPLNQYDTRSCRFGDDQLSTNKLSLEICTGNNIYSNTSYQRAGNAKVEMQSEVSELEPLIGDDCLEYLGRDGLQTHDSFGRLMASIIADSPESAGDHAIDSSILTGHQSFASGMTDNHQPSSPGQLFTITDVSPTWTFSSESTKILIVGYFSEGWLPYTESNVFLACGDSVITAEVVQPGVFRCWIPAQAPGSVSLFLTFDGHIPFSQVLTFEFRDPVSNGSISSGNNSNWEEFQLHLRLAHLLFSSRSLSIFSTKHSQNALKDAKNFVQKTSNVSNSWVKLTKMVEDAKIPFPQAKESLFETTLRNRIQEWLVEKVITGSKITERDELGQGVLHLCAILGYIWAVTLFSYSNLSLDHRDKYGWTALHWAAYCGREKMVAALLSAGSKPNLVTDPTSDNPGGCTAADLASQSGYDGLSAYLAEKALIMQLNDMTLAGNVSGSLRTTSIETVITENLTEEEINLKETLTAYRNAADAAARIQVAIKEHSLKVRIKAVQSSEAEIEARNIIAALKIQHAFRRHDKRKKMAAAALRIQDRFRTWKTRREFLHTRQQAIKIQAVFRGYLARKLYRKIVWSVGILEKAILRWRMKGKGIRGIQAQPDAILKSLTQERDVEEEFYQASRKQAEDRVERSVIKVQSLFRSKKAQEDYRRMKLAYTTALMVIHLDSDME